MNTTVVRKRRTLTVDPFDSYSILKPEQGDWLLPKPSHRPAVIVTLASILIMVGVGTIYDFGHLFDNGGSVLDSAKLSVAERESPVVRQGKSDKSRPNAAAVGSVSVSSTADAYRRNEKQKRQQRRPTTSTASPLRSAVRAN